MRLFAIDVDGTLLTSDLVLTAKTKEAIQTLNRRGDLVVLSSGRPPRSILPLYQELGLKTPIVAYNGALVYNPSDPSFKVREYLFSKESLIRIEEQCGKGFLSLMCESKDVVYGNHLDEALDKYFPYKGMENRFGPLRETLKEDCYTALFKVRNEEDDLNLEKAVLAEGFGYRRWRNSPYSEAYVLNSDKGHALQYIQESLGIKKGDTIAVGDSDNDLPMMEHASYPYLMKNYKKAPVEGGYLRSPEDNDHEGLALVLEAFL